METHYIALEEGTGLKLNSGPGRDLIFKVTGEDTGGSLDYFIVQVAAKNGPPLHVHHFQEETIHVLKGHFKVRIGEEIFYLKDLGVFDNLTLIKMWSEATPKAIFPGRKIGALKEGYEASFLALEGNPIEDLNNVHKIKFRFKQGVLVNP